MQKLQALIMIGVFIAVAITIVMRLDINGIGSAIWFLASLAMVFIRRPHETENMQNKSTLIRQNTLENIALALVFLGALILPLIHLCFGLLRAFNYTTPIGVTVLGTLVMIGGLWLFWRSHKDLGRNWNVSLHIREGHSLTTGGVYSRIRHPMYTSIFIIYIAQALLLTNWIIGLSGFASFAFLYLVRVKQEEAMMREEFGEQYDEFCRTRGRILPSFRS
ncbi:MAG: protein-S-isoprenylcysteine O-methyltransferase [Pseudomonadota bacterium]